MRGLIAIILLTLGLASPVVGEPFSVGFPNFPTDLNIVDSDHPVALFLRSSVVNPLMVSPDHVSTSGGKSVSDFIRIGPDYSTWEFRISSHVKFSDGSSVLGEDVVASLQRCRDRLDLPYVVSLSHHTATGRYEENSEWVTLKASVKTPQQGRELAQAIERCPTIKAEAITLFGVDLGRGANLIATGDFVISDIVAGRRYQIERIVWESSLRRGVGVMDLRGFDDAGGALNSLRVGGISGFYTNNQEVLAKAKKDETLRVDICSGKFAVVRRSGVVLPCLEALNVLDIKEPA